MTHPESGVIACDDVASKLERCARRAYQLAKLDPDHPASTADVLAGLFRSRGLHDSIRLLDLGVESGRCVLEFQPGGRSMERSPSRALMLRRQRRETATLACAHGCAQFVDWAMNLNCSRTRLIALAMAIVIPAAPLREWADQESRDPETIARTFATDVDVVYERLAAIRGSASGERVAITPVG